MVILTLKLQYNFLNFLNDNKSDQLHPGYKI